MKWLKILFDLIVKYLNIYSFEKIIVLKHSNKDFSLFNSHIFIILSLEIKIYKFYLFQLLYKMHNYILSKLYIILSSINLIILIILIIKNYSFFII